MDPKNKFFDPTKPNAMDRSLLGLFDAIEGCQGDIDERLEALHQTWKQMGFLTKTLYRTKLDYLFKGVGYEVAMRAGKLQTDSTGQMLQNWNRVQNIYNGDDWTYRAAKAWIGPVVEAPVVEAVRVEEPRAAATQARYNGRMYYSKGGGAYEGILVDLVMDIRRSWQEYRARKAPVLAVPTTPDQAAASWDDGVVTDA